MVRYCFVKLCNNTRYRAKGIPESTHVPLYRFPNNPEIREKWVQGLITFNNQESTLNVPKTATICAKHFEENCFEKIGFSCTRLKPNSIPTIFPHTRNKRLKIQATDDYEDNNCEASQIVQEQSLQMMNVSNLPNEEPVQTVNIQHDITITPSSEILSTPKKKKIRYPGDISNNLEEMTPRRLRQSIHLLQKVCQKKCHKIKRLQSLQNRQKKKIKSLQTLLAD